MFLAAAPYFQYRFRKDQWVLNHFQPAETSVSTVTNLLAMLVLAKSQKGASYPKRISASLIINIIAFTALALSTLVYGTARAYFGFLMVSIFAASYSTALIQNGLFSFSSGFGRSEYTQAIMTGQAVAGVLPPLAQIISVLVVEENNPDNPSAAAESPTSAFIYFLTATVISVFALVAFLWLLRHKSNTDKLRSTIKPTLEHTSEGDALTNQTTTSPTQPRETEENPQPNRTEIPLIHLFRKLPYMSLAVFICFAVTMVFPVFTASIQSNNQIEPAIFIPLAFLLWNTGDLLGRLITLWPKVSLTHHPFVLFCISMARLLFIPLYFLCNIKNRGAVVQSDLFYLVVVQFLFGFSNGYLGSECMMGAGEWVSPEERQAAGGFMGLMLVGGLTVGSLLSFGLGDI